MQLENERKVAVGSALGYALLDAGFRLARALGRALLFIMQALALLGSALLCVMTLIAVVNGAFGPTPFPSNLQDFLTATHLALIFLTLPLSFMQLALPKGRRHHKILGYAWAALMLAASILSFGIHGINGGFSFPHIFSVMALVFVPLIVFLARRKMRTLHRIAVLCSILFFQVGAGAGTFIPRRALGQMFWPLWQ